MKVRNVIVHYYKKFSGRDFKKINDIQQQVDDINIVQEEKDIFQNIGCCSVNINVYV
jgi:hypothetical protein